MEDREAKEAKRKKQIIIGASVVFLLFLAFIWVYSLRKIVPGNKPQQQVVTNTDKTIVYEQPILSVFGKRMILNQYPDTIRIHNPYLLVITPENPKETTIVINTETQKQVAAFPQILLDYNNGDILYSNGKTTFFNKIDLHTICQQGFIVSSKTIDCITPKAADPLDNKLIVITPQSGEKVDVYQSSNLLLSVTSIKGILFVGEKNMQTHKTYLRIENASLPIPTEADIVYMKNNIDGKIYFATFKVSATNQDAMQYELLPLTSNPRVKLVQKGKIAL